MSVRRCAKLPWVLYLLFVFDSAFAQSSEPASGVPMSPMPQAGLPDLPIVPSPPAEEIDEGTGWLDAGHRHLHALLWRSAMGVDHYFGGDWPAHTYADQTRGSITPVVLWDEHDGFQEKLRFRVKMPLPYIGERFDAFAGTFTRDEFVTEREQASGAIPRQRAGGRVEDDQTLIGIQYRGHKNLEEVEPIGGEWEADAGIRIRSPIDPFIKGGYRWTHVSDRGLSTTLRETAFWQNSEKFGLTSRVDFEAAFANDWVGRWTTSGTISQRTKGVRGYMALGMYRTLPRDRSVAGQLFSTGEFDADVPIDEFGFRAAYRMRLTRDWLVLELRPSVTWPKDDPGEPRKPSWGFGIGFEMFFGMDEFQGRPVTF